MGIIQCGKEEHSHSQNDDAISARVEKLAEQIQAEVKGCCDRQRAEDIADWACSVIKSFPWA
jgi:hypothetical protein